MLSLLDHTRVRLADNSEREARRSGDARYDKRSHGGLRHFHRKYAERRKDADAKGGVTSKS